MKLGCIEPKAGAVFAGNMPVNTTGDPLLPEIIDIVFSELII
jgi:hypothetical protein